jgi:hypothetical protein
VPNAGTSRKGSAVDSATGFPISFDPTEPGRPGIEPSGSPVFVLGRLRRKLDDLVPVSAMNLRGGGGLTPNDWSGAAAGLTGKKEAPRIVGGDGRIAAKPVTSPAGLTRLLSDTTSHGTTLVIPVRKLDLNRSVHHP